MHHPRQPQQQGIRQTLSKAVDVALTALGSFVGVVLAKFGGSNGGPAEIMAGVCGGVMGGKMSNAVRPALGLPQLAEAEESHSAMVGTGIGTLLGCNMGRWVDRVSGEQAAKGADATHFRG